MYDFIETGYDWFYDRVFGPLLSSPTFDGNPIRLAVSFIGWVRSYFVESPPDVIDGGISTAD